MNVNLNSKLISNYAETKIDADKIKQRINEQHYKDLDKTDKITISEEGRNAFEETMNEQRDQAIPHIEGKLSPVSRQYYVDLFGETLQKTKKSKNMDELFIKMESLYEEMAKEIESKYDNLQEEEYFVSQNGKIEKLSKEKELDLLQFAYESHMELMTNSII